MCSLAYQNVFLLIGILSVVVLKRKLRLFHWLGMLLVCAGALIVGSRCSLSFSLSLSLSQRSLSQISLSDLSLSLSLSLSLR